MKGFECYGGEGFGGLPDEGLFVIKLPDAADRDFEIMFTNFTRAKQCYDQLIQEKFFWNLTWSADLVDGWIKE